MGAYWLKLVGTYEKPFRESYRRNHVDSRRSMRRIHSGDGMILYASGSKRVFAVARVTREVYNSGDENWPYRVDIDYSVNLRIPDGVILDEVSMPKRDLRRAIRRMSYIELDSEEYERAVSALSER